MKKVLLLFSVLLFCFSAQAQRTMTTTSVPYSDLTNPVSINNGAIWTGGSDFQVTLPFAFKLTGQNYSAVNVKAGGGLNFPGAGTRELFVFHTPFGGYYLKDIGTTTSLSAIGYETTGTAGQRVVKIQWKNAGFDQRYPTSSPTDFVNFQIWLFETDNHIEVHFGPHNTTPGTYGNLPGQTSQNQGPSVKFMFDNCSNTMGLNGSANQPSYTLMNICNPNYSFVQGSPSSGTVYNFSSGVTGLSEIYAGEIQLFPNPVKESLKISGLSDIGPVKNLTITNLTGQVIFRETKSFKAKKILEISTEGLAEGVYFVRLELENGQVVTRKIIKGN